MDYFTKMDFFFIIASVGFVLMTIAIITLSIVLYKLISKIREIADDIKEISPDVLRHRILTSFESEARGIDSDQVIQVLLKNITIP